MITLKILSDRVEAIENRNRRVEGDKAWEASSTRKIFIAVVTFLIIGAYMWFIGVPNPFMNALIPTAGFLLSTLSLGLVKQLWLKNIYKKNSK